MGYWIWSGHVTIKFWQATWPWKKYGWLDINYIMMGLIPTGTWCTAQNTKRLHLKFRLRTYVFPLSSPREGFTFPILTQTRVTFISFLFQEFSGNVNSFSLRFNHLNRSRQFQYIRFHPISFEEHPCMQVSVFGCVQGESRTSTIFSLGAIRL